ncbi:MAG: PKD domain-containing protein [Planctomycetota bacterium]
MNCIHRFQTVLSIVILSLAAAATANVAPTADAGDDRILTDDDGDGVELVALDGTGSTDTDGTIVDYAWTDAGAPLATGATADVMLAVGEHTLTLTVTDDGGATDDDTVAIRVFARPTPTPLDIADGFNLDAWCGPVEMQAVYDYASGHDTALDLGELQGGMNDGVGFGLLGGGAMMIGASTAETYSTDFNWFHPRWIADGEGTPEDGILTGADGRAYHIASAGGNPTCPGDWLEAANPGLDWPIVPNVMVAGAAWRIDDWQIASATAELPEGLKGTYVDVNFVLAARDSSDRARNLRILALYGPDGTDAEEIYAFATADGGSGPLMTDADGGADFNTVFTFTQAYRNDTGSTGAVSDLTGNLYEFAVPLALDPDRTLWGVRIEDTAPSLQNNSRGLVILAATAMKVGTDSNLPPTADAGADRSLPDDDGDGVEPVTLDGTASFDPDGTLVDWTWTENDQVVATGASATLDLALGVHEILLTVTDDQGVSGTDTLVVTVHDPLGFNTYYVDFAGGADANTGLSPLNAWKHCPGDPNAAGTPSNTPLYYGDTVIFKGGVVYRGSIRCNRSGQAGHPIVYDGNTAGTFGDGRAIIDGSMALTEWTPCTGPDDADGNPDWAEIYWTYVPAGTTAFNQAYFEDDGLLHPAQDPDVTDPFYHDNTDDFLTHDSYTDTSITDVDYFTDPDPAAWDGSTYIYIHGGNNAVIRKRVTGYDPASQTILFEPMGTSFYSTYAMVNALKILDTPGEFVVREDQTDAEGRPKLYLWPLTPGVAGKDIAITVRDTCFDFGAAGYVTLRGFELRRTGGADPAVTNKMNAGCTGLTIEDNIIVNHASNGVGLDDATDTLVAGNEVRFNKGRGIIIAEAFDSSIRDNVLQKNGGTAIDYYWSHHSDIIGNTVFDNAGGHANGITVYLDSSDILIFGNHVWGGHAACTVQSSTDVTVACNILDGNGSYYAMADWGDMNGLYLYHNVIFNGGTTVSSSSTNVVAKNNIMSGSPVQYHGGVSEYNIFTSLSWTQDPDTLGPGEFEATPEEVFVDFAGGDYRLKPSSPAIDAGVPVDGITEDFAGTPLPVGAAPDIGALEYLGAPIPGDCDGDGDVDLDDFVILKTNFGRTGVTAGPAEGDCDGDGDVDLDDFVILKTHFGT